MAESLDMGVNFATASTNADDDPGYACATFLALLFADLVIYSTLALYISNLFPYDDSPRQKPWFFLMPYYWFPRRRHVPASIVDMDKLFSTGDIEPVPASVREKTAVAIHHLQKEYYSPKFVAVNDFSFEMYEDEILAVLGHNGAGKTTLINMLTGIVTPASGTAFIYDNDISLSGGLAEARTMLGYCPQHDVLFDDFTVKEHLIFFARLRGFSQEEAILEYERLIRETAMLDKKDTEAKSLSGGQKRKLSIAIAVVGNPKVLILDEPSSGVDVYSQRFLWDLIRGYKRNRSVIITTQSMQEADVLADRKLIMSNGKLRCAGSSMFLKNRFGVGYYLTMAMRKDANADSVNAVVNGVIPSAQNIRSHAGEMMFLLPKGDIEKYATLFDTIDKQKDALMIDSYGVSLTTMEDIFLRLAEEGADAGEADLKAYGQKTILRRDRTIISEDSVMFSAPYKGSVSTARKLWALMRIRMLLLIRSRWVIFFQLLFPLVLSLVLGAILTTMRNTGSGSSRIRPVPPAHLTKGVHKVSDLMMEQVFLDQKGRFFYENQTGGSLEKIIDALHQRQKSPFDYMPYATLNTSEHYGGYILKTVNSTQLEASIAYNASAVHAIPYLTNLLLNAFFRAFSHNDETFHFASQPFGIKAQVEDLPEDTSSNSSEFTVGIAFILCIALSMVPGVFGLDVCRDRVWKARSQIRMTGCSFWLYWTSAFLVHFAMFCVTLTVVIICAIAFRIEPLVDLMGYFILLFTPFATATILFSYCLSFLFSKIATATTGMILPPMLLALILFIIAPATTYAYILQKAFPFIFPAYTIFGGLYSLLDTQQKRKQGESIGYMDAKTYFPWNLSANIVQIPLLILLLVILESAYYNQNWLDEFGIHGKKGAAGPMAAEAFPNEDDDVARERQLVATIDPKKNKNYALVLRNVWKEFRGGGSFGFCTQTQKIADKNLSMSFPKGEIFGLLGPNGAGKTTALSLITGEVSLPFLYEIRLQLSDFQLTPTRGDVHANGSNIHTETKEALQTMGSCPQGDTLWEDITVAEHLRLFGTLNGLPEDLRKEAIKRFTEGLRIKEHVHKRASALSGGTKRKVTFIISMIGNRPLVMLDEPSTGMDPQSKRSLWDVIMASFTGARGAVLTTHSMEEADALCDRIGIIVKGELQCIGSSQHLKNKFGSGYILEIKLRITDGMSAAQREQLFERAKNAVTAMLPRAHLEEQMHNRMSFSIPQQYCPPLGQAFAQFEQLKAKENLEEYNFSQSTIEQVFLHFARMHDDVVGVNPRDTVVGA